ncbi:CHAT domain-containing protein [Anabaena sp. CCY 9613]|uniref:CHAT domain-containing protein n=1 Tax=Anabaena sp. CCY 9613 TaxID=3103868 RepID=UPI0039C60E0E
MSKNRGFWANFGVVRRKTNKLLHLFLYFFITVLCIIGSPVLAQVSSTNKALSQLMIAYAPPQAIASTSISLFQQGKVLYDTGNFAAAVQILQQAAAEYRQQGDNLKLATTLSNLSLAYQQLGAWTEAQQAITDSLNLLRGQTHSQNLPVFAQSLDIQGRLQLAMGQTEAALATWQQTAAIYKQTNNYNGVVRSQINQAQAWRTQGFYRRAVDILEAATKQLASQPDSREKALGWRSLGDALLVSGDLEISENALQQSLKIAQRLKSDADIGASLLSLANNARTGQKKQKAINYYQQTFQISPLPLTKVQAQINHLSLLIEDQQLTQAQGLIPSIQSQLTQLPPSRASIYAQIHLAQSLMKLSIRNGEQESAISPPVPNPHHLAKLLATTVQQSRNLGDQRAEAYALLSLGSLYEQMNQLSDAQDLTQQGLILAQTSHAPEIAYRLQWQLGRLLRAQKDIPGAIAAYDTAVDILNSLRNDLVAINQDVQFNFRDSVEPVYRQSVDLLLQSPDGTLNDSTLNKVRQRIETLQLAELDNFFREACLQGNVVSLDQVVDQDNVNAAIFYPIILPEQIHVIAKIPHQSLRHYSTNISQTEVEQALNKLRYQLVNPSATNAIKKQSQQVYKWLIQPVESELSASKVNTLVFVLDGALRNLPMAALYDGQQFLVEKYAIALSIGLQLQNPKPLLRQNLRALTAGLTQPPPDYSHWSPLPAIKSEVNLIASAGVSTTSLLDQQFTSKALEKQVNTTPYNVVHLATHGQFSSSAKDTFILAADGPINVRQFDSILRNRHETQAQDVELLVLSACQTASGDDHAALGLAGAAVRAGAQSTLASLWQIDDESTAFFVGKFYQELHKGNITKAAALRHAQLELLQHPNYKAPSFWSTYVLIGNWL